MPVSGAHPFEGCPAIQLEIGKKLLQLREVYINECFALLPKLAAERMPAAIWKALISIAFLPAAKTKKLREELAQKRPVIAQWLRPFMLLLRIETLLMSGTSEEQKEQIAQRRIEMLKDLVPQLLIQVYSELRKKRRGRGDSTRLIALQALEKKLKRPSITWLKLAQEFFPEDGAAHMNTLRVQIIGLEKELTAIGLPLNVKCKKIR